MSKLSLMVLMVLPLLLPSLSPADELAELKAMLTELVPEHKPDSISLSPIPSLYQVAYGTQVFYTTKDGRYLVEGDIIDLQLGQNLTESKRAEGRILALKQIPEETMVIFAPEQIKHILTVFTDADCAFCRKLHKEMAELNKHGIKVRYMAFPRTEVDTPSYNKAISVWCANDRKDAMTRAKAGQVIDSKTCDNPVERHLKVAKSLGVQGTPAVLLEDGSLLYGYMPVDELVEMLEEARTNPSRQVKG